MPQYNDDRDDRGYASSTHSIDYEFLGEMGVPRGDAQAVGLHMIAAAVMHLSHEVTRLRDQIGDRGQP